MPDTLTTGQAAEKLGCSSESIRRMIKTGTLPAHRLTTSPKSSWRIYAADINLLEQRRATWYHRFEQPEPQAAV
jgi:excisionase family DNA binding protein